jgi:nitroreductase
MEFFEVIEKRRSVRAFADAPVQNDKLERILAAARLAPSAGNLQAFQIAVIEDEATKKTLAAAAMGQAFLAEAPVVLVFCASPEQSEGRYGERGASLFCLQDATIAACYAQLAATALGLASCWVGAFDEGRVSRALKAPPRLRPAAMMPIGAPAEAPERPQRRAPDALARRGAW